MFQILILILLLVGIIIGFVWGVSMVIGIPATLSGGFILEACVPAWHDLGTKIEEHLETIALISVIIVILLAFISKITMIISLSYVFVGASITILAYANVFEKLNYAWWSFVLAIALGLGVSLNIIIKKQLYNRTLCKNNYIANIISVILRRLYFVMEYSPLRLLSWFLKKSMI